MLLWKMHQACKHFFIQLWEREKAIPGQTDRFDY